MMYIISSATDIRTYIQNNHPDVENVSEIVDAIRASDHPPYGRDWSDWLDVQVRTIAEDIA